MSCKHLQQWVNQGLWSCGLYDKNNRQIHPECNCENCPDYEEISSWTQTSATNNNEVIEEVVYNIRNGILND